MAAKLHALWASSALMQRRKSVAGRETIFRLCLAAGIVFV